MITEKPFTLFSSADKDHVMSLADYLDAPIPKLVLRERSTGTSATKPSYSKMDDAYISLWDSFESEANEYVQVKSLELGPINTPFYAASDEEKEIYSEKDVDYAIRDYVASRMKALLDFQHGNTFGFEAPDHRVLLRPDLVFERKLGNRKAEPLLVLELKTPWVLEKEKIDGYVNSIIEEQQIQEELPESSTSRAYNLRSTSTVENSQYESTAVNPPSHSSRVSLPITQLYGYMSVNHLKYGVLTSYTTSYFLRRIDRGADQKPALHISTAVSSEQLVRSLFYILNLSIQSPLYISPYNTPIISRKVFKSADVFKEKEIVLGEIRFDSKHAYGTQSSGAYGNSLTTENTKSFYKMFDCKEDNAIQEAYNTEVKIYQVLNIIDPPISPRFRGCYCAYGIFYLIELEPCGKQVNSQDVSIYKNEILECFNRLHEARIVHNDVAERNILLHNNQIFICDFGQSKLKSDCSYIEWHDLIQREKQEIDKLLSAQSSIWVLQ